MLAVAPEAFLTIITYGFVQHFICPKQRNHKQGHLLGGWMKFSKQFLGISFCLLLAVLRINKIPPNHYKVLGYTSPVVPNDVQMLVKTDLINQYRTEEGTIPNNILVALETLKEKKRQYVYVHMGDYYPDGVKPSSEQHISDLNIIIHSLMNITVFYWLSYMLCYRRDFQSARQYLGLYSLLTFIIEMHLRFNIHMEDIVYVDSVLGFPALPFEYIQLIQFCYPLVFGLCMLISYNMYEEIDVKTTDLLHALFRSNQLLLQKMIQSLDIAGAPQENLLENTSNIDASKAAFASKPQTKNVHAPEEVHTSSENEQVSPQLPPAPWTLFGYPAYKLIMFSLIMAAYAYKRFVSS